jgi:hypothetical protein
LRAIGSAVHRPCAASCGDRDMARLRLATRRWAWTSARPVWCILAQVRRRTCPLERGCAVSPYPIDRICHFSHMCDPVQACGVARTHQGAPAARSQRTYGAPCAPAARVTAAPGTDPRDPWWTGEGGLCWYTVSSNVFLKQVGSLWRNPYKIRRTIFFRCKACRVASDGAPEECATSRPR